MKRETSCVLRETWRVICVVTFSFRLHITRMTHHALLLQRMPALLPLLAVERLN